MKYIPSTYHVADSQRDSGTEWQSPEFENRIIFMSKLNECISNSEEVKDFAKRFPLGHLSFLGLGEEENGMERKITNLKDSGILLQMSWLPISKTADIQHSELPVRWIGDS